jgi:hypothetical protein
MKKELKAQVNNKLPYFTKERAKKQAIYYLLIMVIGSLTLKLSGAMSLEEVKFFCAVVTVWFLLYVAVILPIYIKLVRSSGKFIFLYKGAGYHDGLLSRIVSPLGREPFKYGLEPFGRPTSYVLLISMWFAILMFVFMPALAILSRIFGIDL